MIDHVMRVHLGKTVKSHAVAKIQALAIRKMANALAVRDGRGKNVTRNAVSDTLVIIVHRTAIVISIIR